MLTVKVWFADGSYQLLRGKTQARREKLLLDLNDWIALDMVVHHIVKG